MGSEWKQSEDDYKRESDRKWRERVDERLASLTTGEQVQNDRLDDDDEEIQAIRDILDGDPKVKDDNGVLGDLKALLRQVNAIGALIAPDAIGSKGGIVARLSALEERESERKVNQEYRWKFYVALVAAVFAFISTVVSNLDKITAILNQKSNDPVAQMIDRAKNPKGRHIRIRKVVSQDDGE